jgi:hypothetical protein
MSFLCLAAPLLGLVIGSACAEADSSPDVNLAEASEAPSFAASGNQSELAELRQVTVQFHDFDQAVAAGYEVEVTPCWTHRSHGAMGYHYGKGDLLRDGKVSLMEPELLMYEPQAGGQKKLVGMEYLVFIEDWEKMHGKGAEPPSLLGQKFKPHSILPVYKLHIWLWENNPSEDGIFADWNPNVSCVHADSTEVFD